MTMSAETTKIAPEPRIPKPQPPTPSPQFTVFSANPNPHDILKGKRLAFVGKLASMPKREAAQLVRRHGAVVVEKPSASVHLAVVGEEELPVPGTGELEDWFDEPTREAVERGTLEVVTETELWQRLGLVDRQQELQRLYTPAMLAEMLGVPVAVIRRWHRRGLIVPVREVRRLPYFDFREVVTARRLAELLAGGVSPRAIEKKLEKLARYVPGISRPLAQLSVIIHGKEILLRQGDGLIEPGGQFRFDFEAAETKEPRGSSPREDSPREAPPREAPPREAPPREAPPREAPPRDAPPREAPPREAPPREAPPREAPPREAPPREDSPREASHETLAGLAPSSIEPEPARATPEQMCHLAAQLEEDGQLAAAGEMYRAAMAAGGPTPETCFQVAELLYRQGDLAGARERYYAAIELDEDYVEARANLGCVLAELGQHDLAIAAFEGTLAYHADYADVHYHLARTLDETGQRDRAEDHWRAFLDLAPDSPWAEEARQRLAQ